MKSLFNIINNSFYVPAKPFGKLIRRNIFAVGAIILITMSVQAIMRFINTGITLEFFPSTNKANLDRTNGEKFLIVSVAAFLAGDLHSFRPLGFFSINMKLAWQRKQ
jgi:hypothetical protein